MTVPRTPSPGSPRGSADWDLSFIGVGALASAVVAGVAAPTVGLVAGWPAALGVLVGAAIVTVFFAVSGLAVAWAGRIGDTLTLPAALLAFFIKAIVLFALLQSLPAEGWLDRRVLAWSVVVGALLWSGVQLRWVWTRQIYYVTPPVGPLEPPPEAGREAVSVDPDRRGTGG